MQDTAVASPTPEAPTATPAPQEPVSAPSGTAPATGGEATGTAPSGESFYSGDVNSLSPELKQVYENMLKDYKSKTQAIAETRKKAEAFDHVRSRSDFTDWWSGANRQQKADFKEQKAEAEQTLGQKISDDDFAKAFQTKDGFLDLLARVADDRRAKDQTEIQQLKQQVSVQAASDLVDSYASEQGADGKAIRPDFNKLEEDNLISGFLSVNPPENKTQGAYRQRLDEAYTWAKAVSAKYYEAGKAEALKIIQQKAAASSQPPTNAVKGAYTGGDPKKITPAEALQMAKKGQRIPQVYD